MVPLRCLVQMKFFEESLSSVLQVKHLQRTARNVGNAGRYIANVIVSYFIL